MKEGARVEVAMSFPPQVTMTEPLQVRFVARVLRVEPQSALRVGVAAMIEDYEFLREEHSAFGQVEHSALSIQPATVCASERL
jgi:hypothetical protein